jgi:WD40 repeat protein
MQDTLTPPALANPFPGLRTFEADEAHLFFGRERQTDELLRRLGAQRFVAVVGVSGSGKSSLVRAGLLPALHAGFLANGRTWLQVCLRPGDRPIERLAENLAGIPAFTPPDLDDRSRAQWVETSLRRSGRGLVEATRLARLSPDENLLVVVDQFEELFRYHPEEAAAFVKLLLEAVHQNDLPIYIIITMRSDYLGDCARFRDLPETLNDAQYLVPRMTREQRRLAIEGPVLVGGGLMSPALLNRLLNDTGEDPDRLPILQHALMRTWEHWASAEPRRPEIDVDDYEAIGGMAEALSRHADGAYDELGAGQLLAERVFKRLTEHDADHREVRRPATVGELQDVTETAKSPENLAAVLEAFLRKGRSFLTRSPTDGPLARDVKIDISHESLIRSWRRLRAWAEEEAVAGETYCRLAEAAARYDRNIGSPLVDQDLIQALAWREATQPNAAWAGRYGGEFARTMRFLDTSRDLNRKENTRRAWRRRLIATAAVLAIVFAVVFTAVVQEVGARRRALATQYLTDAFATAERGDFLRAAHLFGRAADAAVDDDVRRVALLNVWQYAGLIVTSAPETATAGGSNRAVRVAHAVTSANGTTLTWSADGQLTVWREIDGQLRPLTAVHDGIQGAALAPDGRQAASWSKDGVVRLWTTGDNLAQRIEVRHEHVTGLVFAGGSSLLTWGRDGTVRLWSDPAAPRILNHGSPVSSALVIADGWAVTWTDALAELEPMPVGTAGQVGAGNDARAPAHDSAGVQARQASIWNLGSAASPQKCGSNPMKIVVGHGRVLSVNFDGTASLCDPRAGTVIPIKPAIGAAAIADAALGPGAPSRSTLVTWGGEQTATVWRADGRSIRVSAVLPHSSTVAGARFLQDGRLVTWDSDALHLWPDDTGRDRAATVTTFAREISPLAGVQFTSIADDAGRRDIAVTWRANGSLKLWDISQARLVAEVPASAPVDSVELSAKGGSLLVRDRAGRVRTLDIETGSPELDRSMQDLAGATLVTDHAVLTWTRDGATKLLTAIPAQTVSSGELGSFKRIVPDSRGRHTVVIDQDDRVALLRAGQSVPVRLFPRGSTRAVGGAAISADGSQIVVWPTSDVRQYLGVQALPSAEEPQLWTNDASTPMMLEADQIAGAQFSPDGRFLVMWGTGGAGLWLTSNGTRLAAGLGLEEAAVDGTVFSRDSSHLLVWGRKFEAKEKVSPFARLWRTGSLEAAALELTPASPVAGATFAPDGRLFALWTSTPSQPTGEKGHACRVFEIGSSVSHETCFGRIVTNATFVSRTQLLATELDGSARIWTWDGSTESLHLAQPGAMGGALVISKPDPLVLTWSGDAWRLWNAKDGLRASSVVRQGYTILNAQFDEDDRVLRTWDRRGTLRAWRLDADYDFPADTRNRLLAAFPRWKGQQTGTVGSLLKALTGSHLDRNDNVQTLASEEWETLIEDMRRLLDDHHCAYRAAAETMRSHLRFAGPVQY